MDQTHFTAQLTEAGFGEIGEASIPPETFRAEHSHPFEVRALMLDGALHLTCAGEEQRYGPGDIFTMAADREHIERTGAEGARYLVGRKRA